MSLAHGKTIWFDGELRPWEEATVHVMAHGLHYGSSVFEGIRAYATEAGPVIFRLRDHIQRLFDSARVHRMVPSYGADIIEAACRDVVSENGLGSAYIRPVVFRGLGGLGLAAADNPVQVAVAAFEWGAYLGEAALAGGVDAGVSSWTRVPPNTLPALAKAGGNYLSSQLIAEEARRHGYAEGIALDHEGLVAEGSGENVFVVREGRLHTPTRSASILPGLTRDTVITLARARGWEVIEERMPRELLYLADEIFFTGTAAEITPVRSIDGLQVGAGGRGPVTEALQAAFFGLFDGTTEDRWGWLDPVRPRDTSGVLTA
jgi:branched-chain amino acid aminotransferase